MRLSGNEVRNAFDEYINALEDESRIEEEPELQDFLADNPMLENLGRDEYD